jgi:murein DD-endopeptidase MepM/ murein hydrolase activator NlpD
VFKVCAKPKLIAALPQKLTDFAKRCLLWTKTRNNWLLLLLLFLLGFAVGVWRSTALRIQSPAASAVRGSTVPQASAEAGTKSGAKPGTKPFHTTGAQPLSELSSLMQRQTAEFDAMLTQTIRESSTASLVAVSPSEFVRPCPGRVTETFGWKRDDSMGAWNLHAGVFLASSSSASVVAIAGGQVARIEHDTLHGTLITIDHDRHWRSVYGHLSETAIAAGDPVTAGQIIGRAGPGPEGAEGLYFAVYHDGEPQDPQILIPGL